MPVNASLDTFMGDVCDNVIDNHISYMGGTSSSSNGVLAMCGEGSITVEADPKTITMRDQSNLCFVDATNAVVIPIKATVLNLLLGTWDANNDDTWQNNTISIDNSSNNFGTNPADYDTADLSGIFKDLVAKVKQIFPLMDEELVLDETQIGTAQTFDGLLLSTMMTDKESITNLYGPSGTIKNVTSTLQLHNATGLLRKAVDLHYGTRNGDSGVSEGFKAGDYLYFNNGFAVKAEITTQHEKYPEAGNMQTITGTSNINVTPDQSRIHTNTLCEIDLTKNLILKVV